jgi:CubicO group peptidase (beta-lactamase class C family)
MTLTARPLHPDPQQVRSLGRLDPGSRWAAAAERARQIVRADLTEQNLPGVSVAVGTGGDVVWAEGFGWADLDHQTPVAPETRFRIGSVSIPLTSAAAGLLLEQNRLSLDDEIQKYVPSFPKKQWPVTLRQLMANVSGVRNDAGDEEPLMERCYQTTDALRRFADDRLWFEPGTRFSPSSYGWILVSAAVEAAAGDPFFTFMRSRILEPLGMTATVPDTTATETIPDSATFYYPRFAGDNRYGPELAREGDHSCFAGASGFLSTPTDIVRFAVAFNSGKVVQPATVEQLRTPQKLASGQPIEYGLGWTLETIPLAGTPTRMAGYRTRQDFIGGSASLVTFPDRGLVIAVATNTGFADTKGIALKVAEVFAGPAPK